MERSCNSEPCPIWNFGAWAKVTVRGGSAVVEQTIDDAKLDGLNPDAVN